MRIKRKVSEVWTLVFYGKTVLRDKNIRVLEKLPENYEEILEFEK